MSLLILFDGGVAYTTLNITDVDILDKRLILMKLQDEVVVNSDYFDISNYSISIISGTGEVEIVGILPFTDGRKVSTEIIIETQPMTAGTIYGVTITNAKSRTGMALASTVKKVEARFTKGDSILRSMPKHYDKRATSNIAGILLAIGRSDDLIGGSRDDDFTF